MDKCFFFIQTLLSLINCVELQNQGRRDGSNGRFCIWWSVVLQNIHIIGKLKSIHWTGQWKCTSCKIYFFGGQNTMPWLQDSTQRNATIWLSRYQIIIIIQHICKIILDSLLHTTCCNISENCMIAAKCLPSESANLCNHRINVRRCSFGTKGFLFGSGPCQHFHSILVSYLPRNVVISGFLWIWSHPKLLCTKYQHGSRLTVLKLYWLK